MKKTLILSAAALSLALATQAAAAITFKVDGDFWWPGAAVDGALSGTFTTNDAITEVIALNLTTTPSGAFQAFTYDDPADIDTQGAPNLLRVTKPVGGLTYQLELWFLNPLTASGTTFNLGGLEHQEFDGAGNRMLSGVVTRIDASGAVPEPSVWALVIMGFGLTGAMLRRRTSIAGT